MSDRPLAMRKRTEAYSSEFRRWMRRTSMP
jgi:hypothetical protein